MPSSHASRVRRLKPHLLATPAWVSPSFSRAALMRCERLPSSAIAVVGIVSLLRFPSDFLRKNWLCYLPWFVHLRRMEPEMGLTLCFIRRLLRFRLLTLVRLHHSLLSAAYDRKPLKACCRSPVLSAQTGIPPRPQNVYGSAFFAQREGRAPYLRNRLRWLIFYIAQVSSTRSFVFILGIILHCIRAPFDTSVAAC